MAANRQVDPNRQSKFWCFTVNNYTQTEIAGLSVLDPKVVYLCWALEVGAEGTPHIQGYIEVKSKKTRMTGIKKLPGLARAHLEARKGTAQQAKEYCEGPWTPPPGSAKAAKPRNETFREFGTMSVSKQGKRTDLDRVCDMLKDGKSLYEITMKHPTSVVKYGRGIRDVQNIIRGQEAFTTFPLDTFWWHENTVLDLSKTQIFVGPPNGGKTTYALSLYPGAFFCRHLDSLTSFDPDRHTAIVFDDMSFIDKTRTFQIHLTDQDHPSDINIRYVTAHIPSHTIKIFTTNLSEFEVFDMNDMAIHRRCQVHRFGDVNNPPAEVAPVALPQGLGQGEIV